MTIGKLWCRSTDSENLPMNKKSSESTSTKGLSSLTSTFLFFSFAQSGICSVCSNIIIIMTQNISFPHPSLFCLYWCFCSAVKYNYYDVHLQTLQEVHPSDSESSTAVRCRRSWTFRRSSTGRSRSRNRKTIKIYSIIPPSSATSAFKSSSRPTSSTSRSSNNSHGTASLRVATFLTLALRTSAWKLLLKYMPTNQDNQLQTLQRKRKEYFVMVNTYIENPSLEQDAQEKKIFKLINDDVLRTLP